MNSQDGVNSAPLPRLNEVFKCPLCRSRLLSSSSELQCANCSARFPVIDGIPDLRTKAPSWIDVEEERAYASQLLRELHDAPSEAWVRRVFSDQRNADPARTELRTQQVLKGPERLRGELDGWLRSAASETGLFIDIGCGPGTLLAATSHGRQGIGIDVSLVWLLVAKRLLRENGVAALLAAAMADALPLADGSITGVISLDVIEHVDDPRIYLREIDRVLAAGGQVALSTPNRYSLAAEPHVFIWGVGWLPRRWQGAYVRWRSGKSYDYVRLLGYGELERLLRSETRIKARIFTPPIPAAEINRFSPRRAFLARAYNRLVSLPGWNWIFLQVGAFFRVVGSKC